MTNPTMANKANVLQIVHWQIKSFQTIYFQICSFCSVQVAQIDNLWEIYCVHQIFFRSICFRIPSGDLGWHSLSVCVGDDNNHRHCFAGLAC